MDTHARNANQVNTALAFFTLDECKVRVEVATSENRNGSLGGFELDSVRYVLLVDAGGAKTAAMLTRREREIALQIARGYGTKQIARDLGISPHTIVTYVNRIRCKVGARNRPEMVAALLGG